MRSNYNVNIIVMEGADCCGKSTQTKALAKSLGNAIIIHHPTKLSIEKNDVCKLMSSVVYNDDWLENVKSNLDKSKHNVMPFKEVEDEMKRMENIIRSNIHQNYEDQCSTIGFLASLYDQRDRFINSRFITENCICVYNGEILEIGSSKYKPKLSELLKLFANDPRECYIIFDRMFISSECYNSFIVAERLKYIMTKLRTSEYFNLHHLDAYEKKYAHEMEYIYSLTLNRCNEIIKRLNLLFVDFCTNQVYLTSKYKNNTGICQDIYPIHAFNMLDPRIQTFVFEPSRKLYEESLATRQMEAYDINTFIHNLSNKFYLDRNDTIFKLVPHDIVSIDQFAVEDNIPKSITNVTEYLKNKCNERFVLHDGNYLLTEHLKHYVPGNATDAN